MYAFERVPAGARQHCVLPIGPSQRTDGANSHGQGGNLDNWDPALIDALSPGRRVVTFDNAGVGGSAGNHAEFAADV